MLREIMKEILKQEEAEDSAALARIDSLYPVPQPPEASLESPTSKFEEAAKPEASEGHISVNAETSEIDEESFSGGCCGSSGHDCECPPRPEDASLSGGCNGGPCDPCDPFERYQRPDGPSGMN